MTQFLGTHLGKLDKKGRISVPASFRAGLERLGTEDIVSVTFRDATGNKAFRLVEWRVIDSNTIRCLWDTVAPALNSIRVTIGA